MINKVSCLARTAVPHRLQQLSMRSAGKQVKDKVQGFKNPNDGKTGAGGLMSEGKTLEQGERCGDCKCLCWTCLSDEFRRLCQGQGRRW